MSISICSFEAEVFSTSSMRYLLVERGISEDLKGKDLTLILKCIANGPFEFLESDWL